MKHEWSRFEKERANWEAERAELQAKIAFLQGERRGQENLKRDLVRRIRMLEYALKQERAKNHELRYGTKLQFSEVAVPEPPEKPNKGAEPVAIAGQRDSKTMLRAYLAELGYPEYVLETRMSRLRAPKMYGLHPMQPDANGSGQEPESPGSKPPPPPRADSLKLGQVPTKEEPANRTRLPQEANSLEHPPAQNSAETSKEEGLPVEVTEAFTEFEFLNNEDGNDSSDDEGSDDEEETGFDEEQEAMDDETAEDEFTFSHGPQTSSGENEAVEMDLPQREGQGGRAGKSGGKGGGKKGQKKNAGLARPSRKAMGDYRAELMGVGEGEGTYSMKGKQGGEKPLPPLGFMDTSSKAVADNSGLGELQWVSWDLRNDAPPSDSSKRWSARYTMRSHLDAVTCVAFHPTEHMLVSGSEDRTLKIWNLQQQTRRNALIDVEPGHTLRGHRGAVLSLVMSNTGVTCYSGGADSAIRCWLLPVDREPFDTYDPCVSQGALAGHTDAVWDLAMHPSLSLLLSCSADGTCRLWSTQQQTSPEVSCIPFVEELGLPTSVDFVRHELRQMVVSYNTAQTLVYDIETCKVVTKLDSAKSYDHTPLTQVNKVRSHPTLPTIVTAHEDKFIRFFDSSSGQMQHEMIAHMDAVTGIAIDPNGLYVVSASHDGSLRFWSMENYICVQEISAHRKRFDEAIFNVACHPSESMFSSAGADSIAKVFA